MDTATLLAILGNILSSVGIVLLNKYLWVVHGYHFAVALSCFHFIFTTFATRVLLHAGFFTFKPSNFRSVLPLCIGSLGSVAFMNLNLAYNSVGFYQISKLACIPVTLVLEYFMYGTQQSRDIKLSLFIVLLGVGVATVTDVELNFLGSIYAAIAVLFTTLAQIFAFSHQKELGLDAMQLLYHTSPVIAVGMAILIPFFDQILPPSAALGDVLKPNLMEYSYTPSAVLTILLTCVFAVAVNLTNYLVIGKTSPITYQVVGHLKTCLVLVLGFIVFQYAVVFRNIFGIFLAVVGMILYSEIKRRASPPPKTASSGSTQPSSAHSNSHGHSHGDKPCDGSAHGHSHSHGGHGHSHGHSEHDDGDNQAHDVELATSTLAKSGSLKFTSR